MPEKLTVLIPCKDEERNIRPCIESVKGIADELLVADSGSSDRTMDIAREYGARIIEREYVNSADFKNWAIPQATHPWVFRLDADERVTPELAEEVRRTLDGAPRHDAYRVRRRSYFLGHEIRRSGWGSDGVIALFRRDGSRYQTARVHAGLLVESGDVGRLSGLIRHYTFWSLSQWVGKADRYTTWAAEDLHEKGRRAGVLTLLLRPPFKFLRDYVLKLGFLDGVPGILVCSLSGYSVFMKYAKLWQMRKGIPQPDPEAEGTAAAPDAPGGRSD